MESKEKRDYWEGVGKKFSEIGYSSVIIPGSIGLENWYGDYSAKSLVSKYYNFLQDPILDVGCGVGRWSLRMAKKGKRVVAFDFSRIMLQEAKRRAIKEGLLSKIDLICASITALPFRPETFSVAVSVTVLQHLVGRDPISAAVNEIKNAVKKSGTILIYEQASEATKEVVKKGITISLPRKVWEEVFRLRGLKLVKVLGSDLGLFTSLVYRWRRKLDKRGTAIRVITERTTAYVLSKFLYFLVLNCLIVPSLLIDLCLRQKFWYYSVHKLFILKKLGF